MSGQYLSFTLTLTRSLKGEGNKESSAAIILSGGYFLSFLGAGAASCLHMVPVSLQAGHFLGLQRVSTLLPHFSQVKTAIDKPPGQIKPPGSAAPMPGGLSALPGKAAIPVAL
jgi:hypothetical protein